MLWYVVLLTDKFICFANKPLWYCYSQNIFYCVLICYFYFIYRWRKKNACWIHSQLFGQLCVPTLWVVGAEAKLWGDCKALIGCQFVLLTTNEHRADVLEGDGKAVRGGYGGLIHKTLKQY